MEKSTLVVYQNGKEKSSVSENKSIEFFRISYSVYRILVHTNLPLNQTLCLYALTRYLDVHHYKKQKFKEEVDIYPLPVLQICKEATIYQKGYSKKEKLHIFNSSLPKECALWIFKPEPKLIRVNKICSYRHWSVGDKRLHRHNQMKEIKIPLKWDGFRKIPLNLIQIIQKFTPRLEDWNIPLSIYLTQRYEAKFKNTPEDILFEQILNNSKSIHDYFKRNRKSRHTKKFKTKLQLFCENYYKAILK